MYDCIVGVALMAMSVLLLIKNQTSSHRAPGDRGLRGPPGSPGAQTMSEA